MKSKSKNPKKRRNLLPPPKKLPLKSFGRKSPPPFKKSPPSFKKSPEKFPLKSSRRTKSSGRAKMSSATVAARGAKPWVTSKKHFAPSKTTKTKTKTKATKKPTTTKPTKKIRFRDAFGRYAIRPKPVKKRRKVVSKPAKPVKKLLKSVARKPAKPVKKLRAPIKASRKGKPKKKIPSKPIKPSVKKPIKKAVKKPAKKPVKKPIKPVKKKKPVKKPPPEIPKRRITQIFGANRREKIRPITQEDRERLKEAALDIAEVRIQTRRLKLPFGPTEISPLGYEYYELIASLEKMSSHDVYTLFMSP